MKWDFSPVGIALVSFRRWLNRLRRSVRGRVNRVARSKRKTTDRVAERRTQLEVLALEQRESVGGDCSPTGLWMAASGMVGAVVVKTLVDSFLAPAGPEVRDVSALPSALAADGAPSSVSTLGAWVAVPAGESAPVGSATPAAEVQPTGSGRASLDAFFA